MSSEIMGLSHLEREIVARTVLYNGYLADYEDVADRLDQQSFPYGGKIIRHSARFNTMDASHKQRSLKTIAQLRDKELIITVETDGGHCAGRRCSLQDGLFEAHFQHKAGREEEKQCLF